jgi:hypothetical protein
MPMTKTKFVSQCAKRCSYCFFFCVFSIICLTEQCCAQQKQTGATGYNRIAVLNEFADIVAEYAHYRPRVDSAGGTENMFVFDLSDTSNRQYPSNFRNSPKLSIRFVEHHFYHFAYAKKYRSVSHIAFLDGGKLTVFRSLNCPAASQALASVVEFAQNRVSNLPFAEGIVGRIKSYRHYGYYRAFDNFEMVRCD